MGMYGGGSGGGETKFEWNADMAPYMRQLLGEVGSEGQRPFTPYTGQRIADINNPDTAFAADSIRGLAMHGTAEAQGANTMLRDTLAGNYGNPWTDQMTPTYSNSYIGDSPMFRARQQRGINDITSAYRDATAPQTDAAFVQNGTFGSGDYQRAVDKNQQALGRSLGDYMATTGDDQWKLSAGLKEGELGRQLQAGMFDKSSGLNSWEQERQREMAAVPLAYQSQGLAYTGANAMMGLGDIYRQNDQSNLNLRYQDWQDMMNNNRNNLNWRSGMFGAAMGGLGPNQTTTIPGYGGNMASNILGGALAGYGMFRNG